MLTSVGRDRICVVRAVAGTSDTLAHRRTLERAIGPLSLRPRGLSSRAIVCVRRLRGSMVGHEWTARLESHVEQAVSRAVRPFAEMVPATANAVVFVDETEMLACLARDWRRRDAWWWRGLLGRDADERLVHQRLLDAPTLVPSVVSLLAEGGAVFDVLRSMPMDVCAALSEGVAPAFALPRGVDVELVGAAINAATHSERETRREQQRAVRTLQSVLDSAHCVDVVNTLPDEARHLLVLCLLVARAPALARAEPCAPLLARWAAWSRSEQRTSFAQSLVEREAARASENSRTPLNLSASTRAEVVAAVPDAVVKHIEPARTAEQGNQSESTMQFTSYDEAPPTATEPAAEHGEQHAATNTLASTRQAPTNVMPAPASTPAPLASGFAGVFYLVNVLLHMELYADFANPERTNLPLTLGDLLALIAARYCGAEIRRDPIWQVLGVIAGRHHGQEPRRTLRAGPVRKRDVRAFDRWLTPLLARMEARMASALAMPAEETFAYLCNRHGTIALTDTQLDVRFQLAEHPLAIRLAGLDRDPGWVPAGGRTIVFHYD